MARMSLLFSLALALAMASAFAHDAPSASASASSSFKIKTKKYSPPCTVGELKTLPFAEMTKLINLKSSSALKMPALGTAFSVCKDYTSFLSTFCKRGDFEFAFHGPAAIMWKVKFAAMSKALLAAQMGFGLGGKATLKLKKNYEGMIHGFAAVPAKIAEISARHQFNAAAKLSVQEQKEFVSVFGTFKKCLNGYFDTAAAEVSASKHVSFGGNMGGHSGKYLSDNFFGFVGEGGFEASASGSGKVGCDACKKKKKAQHQRSLLFAGEDGFRSLNRPYEKHLVGMKA